MDEFGNLDFTNHPNQSANEKKYNTENSYTYSKRPDIRRRRRRKKTKKDPIRTTLDRFSYFNKERNVDNNEVVYGLDYPKPTVSYNYRKPIRSRPSPQDDPRRNVQKTTGNNSWLRDLDTSYNH